MSVLDDPETYSRLDPTGIHKRFSQLPTRSQESWAAGQAWELPANFHTPRRVVVLGVGGSAIGAELIAALAASSSTVPIELHRGYEAPVMDEDTLAVACSFSGETEETLSAFQGTLEQPGMRLTIGTGGHLARIADDTGCPTFSYQWPGPPRTALADGVFPLLAILNRLDAVSISTEELDNTFASLAKAEQEWGPKSPESCSVSELDRSDESEPSQDSGHYNLAKQIARRLVGRLPVIIGTDFLRVAAQRWASEINENSNQWAFHAALPEADHNLVAGFGAPTGICSLVYVVFLNSVAAHERNRLRVPITGELLRNSGVSQEEVDAGGVTMLESAMLACYLGDWVSLYLALINEIDPAPVTNIDSLKSILAQK